MANKSPMEATIAVIETTDHPRRIWRRMFFIISEKNGMRDLLELFSEEIAFQELDLGDITVIYCSFNECIIG